MPESVPPNPWYSASPEANTTTCRPTRHRVRASAASSRAFAPMIRVKRASTGHAASSAREPYTTSDRPISPSVSASSGKPMPHDTTSMRPASVSIPLPSIAFNPFCRPENTSGRSFRCIQVPRAPRSLPLELLGKKRRHGRGRFVPKKFFRFSPVPFAHPVFPQIRIVLQNRRRAAAARCFPRNGGQTA